jgi:DNA-binding SARP family transcriptional activator
MDHDDAPLELRTLGAVCLTAGGEPVLPNRRRELALLAWVLRRAPQRVRREDAAALLWADRPVRRARHSLRQALLTIRRAAGDVLVSDAACIAVGRRAIRLDLAELEHHLGADRVPAALALLRGEFMAGLDDIGGAAFRGWIESERSLLQRLLAGAFEDVLRARVDVGDWERAIDTAETWAGIAPLEEAPHVAWAEALHRVGRSAEAAGVCDAFSRRVHAALREAPSPAFLRLRSEIRSVASVAGEPGTDAQLSGPQLAFGDVIGAWTAAQHGRLHVCVVTSDVPSACARLCDDVERFARTRHGATVLRVHGRAGAWATPWAAARTLLHGLARAPGVSHCSPHDLAELSRLVPAVRQRFARLPRPDGNEAALRRAVANVCGEVAWHAPLLVICDDIAAVDTATRELLLALAYATVSAPVLLVATGYAADAATLAGLADAPHTTRIRLDVAALDGAGGQRDILAPPRTYFSRGDAE